MVGSWREAANINQTSTTPLIGQPADRSSGLPWSSFLLQPDDHRSLSLFLFLYGCGGWKDSQRRASQLLIFSFTPFKFYTFSETNTFLTIGKSPSLSHDTSTSNPSGRVIWHITYFMRVFLQNKLVVVLLFNVSAVIDWLVDRSTAFLSASLF